MNVLDIILIIPLVWAIWSGFRNGIVVQLGGIAGLLMGVWLAFRYGGVVGRFLGLNPSAENIVGFIVIVILTVIVVAIIGRLLSGLFRFAGLAILDRFGGAILALFKMALILGLLLYGFVWINRTQEWVQQEKLEKSFLYKPLTSAANWVFPYIDMVKETLFEDVKNK